MPKKSPNFEARKSHPKDLRRASAFYSMPIIRSNSETNRIIDPTDRFSLICVQHLLLWLFFLGVEVPATAQKYDQEKDSDMVTKDGVDHMRVETKGCGFGQTCAFNIYDSAGNKVIIVTMESFVDPAAVSQSNTKGTVNFSTYIFPTLNIKAEYAYVRGKAVKLAKDVDSNELMRDGMLNEEAVNEFVLVNGMKFSHQRDGVIRVISR